ncbi:MFS transporter [Microbispora sp. SCL1-1]|uniref:MFS transporter n=1 Tax=Microbispora TaxID=2005 RepID=UPI00115A0B5F|nr:MULTISPECIES: MFS transporter [unclassified Microbispora]NJP28143.1 MFS transporter [Microbispora sp. CL1-1]TQS09325.1 MFS transporter [Microbispora sp. SCL1-1]
MSPASTAAASAGPSARRQASGPAFALTAGVIGLCLAASAVPSPLYRLYAVRWHLPTSTVTLIYATYCLGVLASLLVFGRVSDTWGRRPVVMTGLSGLLVAMGLFGFASGAAWLFAARAVQGLATGIAISASGAALLELRQGRDPATASLANVVASALGVGAGGLLGAVLLQFAPAPLVTPFVVLAVLVAVLLLGMTTVPETVPRVSRSGLRIATPGVPRQIRAPFVVAGLAITCAWSIIGIYLGLAGTLAPALLHTASPLAAGLAILALGGASAVPPLVARALPPAVQIVWGTLALIGGIASMAWSLSADSAVLFVAASVVIGIGVGFAMFGALRTVGAAAPPDGRARVMAAFYIVAYAAISLPAVAAGFVAQRLGAEATFQIFGAGIVAVSVGTLLPALARHRAQHRAQHRA